LSTIEQTVAFHSDTARVDFITHVDWHESKKLLKAYFPVDIRADYATFDIQSGTIRRATHANTSWDAAKHEVYAHKFCDISEARFGVALLNDSKYGYSVRDNNMGLSLLKASKFPDHEADMGLHDFVYSLLPHDRALEESTVFEEAHKLNTPLWAAVFNLGS
jgi:alpha-mannosidase